ncbi:autoinducer binding domain-containing protein [Pseudomonas sp. H9]|uniref:autoinducer binding domain-containing protein n=1 Tax=Pseudomonas sp. H9 TaxID=483968 RepID=UPI001057E6EE|nr:autoinducer binding domain-containing protein [Pseudomonas sp. H9]TDF82035.1 LuxR family transcriptional regulator [Pseudomonas sp. H9]
MRDWNQEQLQQLSCETDEQRMFEIVASLATQLGMEYFSYTLRTPATAQNGQLKTYNNYPAAWNEHYQRCNYLSIDPTVAHCRESMLPLLWQDEVFRETPEFWEHAQRNGLRYGWSQSAHDLRHNESILSVARSHNAIETREFHKAAGQVMWLCNLLHTLILNRQPPPPSKRLSARETEVLKWSAAGKTAADISCILTLSQSTVNFHIRSVITKLDCSNKAGAIAIAAKYGLLD